MTTFECMICWETRPINTMMAASSLGCSPCGGIVCARCFCRDLSERQQLFYVTLNPDSEDGQRFISKWSGDQESLLKMLCTEKDLTDEENDQLREAIEGIQQRGDPRLYTEFQTMMRERYVQIGRTCPFCRATCTWKVSDLPHFPLNSNILTFSPPSNLFRGVWPNHRQQTINDIMAFNLGELETFTIDYVLMLPHDERHQVMRRLDEMTPLQRYVFLNAFRDNMDGEEEGEEEEEGEDDDDDDDDDYEMEVDEHLAPPLTVNSNGVILDGVFGPSLEALPHTEDPDEIIRRRMLGRARTIQDAQNQISLMAQGIANLRREMEEKAQDEQKTQEISQMTLAEIGQEIAENQEVIRELRMPTESNAVRRTAINERNILLVEALSSFSVQEREAYIESRREANRAANYLRPNLTNTRSLQEMYQGIQQFRNHRPPVDGSSNEVMLAYEFVNTINERGIRFLDMILRASRAAGERPVDFMHFVNEMTPSQAFVYLRPFLRMCQTDQEE